jgi:hypothetical protein
MRLGSMATSGLNLIVTRLLDFPELSSSGSAFIDRIWPTSSIIASVKPDGEVQIRARCAQGNRNWGATQTKLQRLFDRKQIRTG